MKTAKFFANEMNRLAQAGAQVFIVRGNHDAETKISNQLTMPAAVTVFTGRADFVEIRAKGGGRVAVEPNWGDHSLMIGAFGFYPEVLPGRIMGYGVDRYNDFGIDAQYQWLGDPHAVTIRLSQITEYQHLSSTYAQGVINGLGILPFGTGIAGSSNVTNKLTSLKASAEYVWDRTLSGTIGYFNVYGSADDTLYGNVFFNPIPGGSAFGRPNGKGLIFDFAYMPFSKGSPDPYPWANAKLGVQYTHYLQLYGGTANFDGLGPYFNGSVWRNHNANDNNTLFLYSWIAF